MHRIFWIFICFFGLSLWAFGQDGHGHDHGEQNHHEEKVNDCGHATSHTFDPGATAFHHISDQNVYSIGPFNIPLPCILKSSDQGWDFFSSGKLHPDGHGNGSIAYNRYLIHEGSIRRVADPSFPMDIVEIGHHNTYWAKEDGKDFVKLCFDGQEWNCDSKSTADGGLFGGGITSFYDFSLTKNVVTMIIVFLLMAWIFLSVAKAYQVRDGQAPRGLQGFIEPIFIFIQDEVAKPFLGAKWEKFLPFLLCLFFFVLGLNLFGQIPFLGGSNVTGNLAVTMVLAIFAFIVTNMNGNKHYWEHIFNMPGIPGWVKVIVTPVEFLGVFIKPLTLMLRLFANITAGHMVVIIFVGLIFLFGQDYGPGAAWGTSIGSILLTVFMMSIELLVAFIQAFVFTILTASYIGAATEEHHH